MNPSILSALITGGLALAGVIITNMFSNKAIEHKLELNQAVMDTKLDALAQEVREHNSNVQQIPVMAKQLEVLEHRVDKMELTNSNDGR